MVAKISEQILLGAEFVCELAGDKRRFVIAAHCTSICMSLHLSVFHHCYQLCWNLKVIASKPLQERLHSALIIKQA